jgi:predicted SnoaL-like aldol condensation-catalyzing enzyme
MGEAMNSTAIVVTALEEMFNDRDATAVDRWVSQGYRQHRPSVPDGPEALRAFVLGLPADFRYERARVLAEGDLVAVHGVYHGWGPEPTVVFDIFRVTDGRLTEHWDALQAAVVDPVGGRSQIDGPAGPDRNADTAASRALVEAFAAEVLVGADYSRLEHYLQPDYHQHNPEAADGIAGFAAAAERWAADGKQLVYRTVHRIIADGDLVLTQSEGDFGAPVAYLDLFRVADGRIVEHWDVIEPISIDPTYSNGNF